MYINKHFIKSSTEEAKTSRDSGKKKHKWTINQQTLHNGKKDVEKKLELKLMEDWLIKLQPTSACSSSSTASCLRINMDVAAAIVTSCPSSSWPSLGCPASSSLSESPAFFIIIIINAGVSCRIWLIACDVVREDTDDGEWRWQRTRWLVVAVVAAWQH